MQRYVAQLLRPEAERDAKAQADGLNLLGHGLGQPRLTAYFERGMARPSVVTTIEQARPFFRYHPMRQALPARFLA